MGGVAIETRELVLEVLAKAGKPITTDELMPMVNREKSHLNRLISDLRDAGLVITTQKHKNAKGYHKLADSPPEVAGLGDGPVPPHKWVQSDSGQLLGQHYPPQPIRDFADLVHRHA